MNEQDAALLVASTPPGSETVIEEIELTLTEEELIARFPVYDPNKDPRLLRYVAAMQKAYSREAKRRAGRILRRRGKGYTK